MKSGLCFTQNVFLSDLFVQIRNQRWKLVPVPNSNQIGEKRRQLEFRPKNCLMTLYLAYGDNVSKIFMVWRDFVPEYHHAKCGGNRTTNKGETEGRGEAHCAAYILPNYPSPNRVKGQKLTR